MQLSVKEASVILNVSEKSIYQWIKQEIIPYYRINDQFRFNRSELLEWATSRQIAVHPDLFKDEKSDVLLSLSDALTVGGIHYQVKGIDQASVLHSIVDSLNLNDEVDRDFLYEVLLARETIGSTGVGNGIAIPHVRNPVVLHVTKPTVTLSFLNDPIDFNSIDGKPVNILFTLICPTVRIHLHLLSRLGFVLHNQDFNAALQRQAPSEEIMGFLKKAEATLPTT